MDAETNRLADRRRSLGMTQEALARKAGVSSSTIQKLEGGKIGLRLDTAYAIAKALDTTVDDLFGVAA